MTGGQVAAHMEGLPLWSLEPPYIRRKFRLGNFRAALAWVNRVGMLAEEQGHHPDFHITSWNLVELVLWTHTVEGLSLNDFVMARKIDDLAARDGLGSRH
ncbi:MAG: 4a-hydroxytetrahydrobiopterin dehydratase [Chlamydiales bacterium]